MESNKIGNIIILTAVVFIVIKTCSVVRNESKPQPNSNAYTSQNWEKSPVDKLIKELEKENNYSIILSDMDVKNPNSSNPQYQHKYKIIIEIPDSVVAEETAWKDVTSTFFNKHVDNMGMEIVSKKDGVITKEAVPAGYANFVGNPQYGQWRERNGTSFWEFYGRYAFMSSMFNLMTFPARRAYWNDYHTNYYGTGRGYYGPSGQRIYGTRGYTASQNGQNTQWGRKSSDFKSKVRGQVSRSSGTSTSRRYSSSSSYNRTSRSSTRSSSGTSYRSRSGGFGK